MFLFAAPLWLWVSGAATAAGAWALLSGRRRVRAVSSLKLWRGIGAEAGTVLRRRWIDPLWLLVFIAMILAGAALAGPEWRLPAPRQSPVPMQIQWAVRSIRNSSPEQTEVFARALEPLPPPWKSFILQAGDGTTVLASREITAEELAAGAALPLPPVRKELWVDIHPAGPRASPMWEADFRRPARDDRTLGVFQSVQTGEAIDPAIARVFAVRPGAQEGNAAADTGVVLANNPRFSMADEPANTVLVIAEPQTPLPGLVPGERIKAPAGSPWAARALVPGPNDAIRETQLGGLGEVRIKALRTAQMDPNWQVLAEANGRPWIAARRWKSADKQIWLIWLASEPATETNWPSYTSFVVFFGAWTDQALDAAPAPAGTTFLDWTRTDSSSLSPRAAPHPLAGWTGAISAALALSAAGWFLWRGRNG